MTSLDTYTNVATAIATISGSILPAGTWVSPSDPPRVSATGWLAIAFVPGAGSGAAPAVSQGIIVVDLTDPKAEPWVIPDAFSGTWNDDDELAMVGATGVVIADPANRALAPFPIGDPLVSASLGGVFNAPVWTTAPGTRFLARRSPGPATPDGTPTWGYVDPTGSFTATTDLPPISQRTGIERRTGADAHELAQACTGSGSPTEAGCALVETDATGTPVATWDLHGGHRLLRRQRLDR